VTVGGHDGLALVTREDWGRACARMQKPQRVVFTLGSDADQMLGAWLCWKRWGAEEGNEVDSQGFLADWIAKRDSGTFAQIVAWDGTEPVAMVELRMVYEATFRKTTLYGDHAWVHPDYRRGGIMRSLVQYCIDTANLLGFEKWMVPVTAGENASAPFLKDLYASFGFKLTGYTMTRTAPCLNS
jgi:GNAT superfamily N-acetyltransferase